MTHTTREAWLNSAVGILRDGLFREHGHVVPQCKVSIGFPGGGSARKRIGEHWHPKSTSDGISQVFISPVLVDPIPVLETLVHELVHAIVPDAGHKKPFKRIALSVGLEGKMRSTVAGDVLKRRLNDLSTELGVFPHSQINLSDRKKQGTRMLKLECPQCGFVARTTQKWLDEVGAPHCACSQEQLLVS